MADKGASGGRKVATGGCDIDVYKRQSMYKIAEGLNRDGIDTPGVYIAMQVGSEKQLARSVSYTHLDVYKRQLLQFFRILMLKDAIMEKMGQSKMEK